MSKVKSFIRNLTPLRAVLLVLGAFLAVVTWSYGSYVVTNDDGDIVQRSATWARNHHLGMFVDRIEEWRYSKPPSTKPADELGLSTDGITVESTVPPTSTLPPELSVEPENITPVVLPALPGEGSWAPLAEIQDGTVVAWATSIRPLADHASVVATFVTIDQSNLVAGLFNGYEMPGGDWVNGAHLVGDQIPSVVATFNGGFRFEHYKGGYFTEGKMLRELREGEATMAIAHDGTVLLGEYGRDMTNDGSWKTLRQNLPLMIDGGEDILDKNPGVNWGEDYHDKIYVLRSAVCQMKSGALMYAIVGEVDVRLLVQSLLVAGCERAMQLDINGNYPRFMTYTNPGSPQRQGLLIDSRMETPERYLDNSTKDYFAFFDPSLLKPGVVK